MNRCKVALSRLSNAGVQTCGGEAVTQLQHALQCAFLADMEGASDALIIAALFHDIGHVLLPSTDGASQRGIDLQHEEVGARFLTWCGYPAEVVEPVRLHVAAKRMQARELAFLAELSQESARTLDLQGGPLSDAETAAFMRHPFAEDALRLRAWDDAAKVAGMMVPDLSIWMPVACWSPEQQLARTA